MGKLGLPGCRRADYSALYQAILAACSPECSRQKRQDHSSKSSKEYSSPFPSVPSENSKGEVKSIGRPSSAAFVNTADRGWSPAAMR